MFYAPDAEVLLSDAFLDSHCFSLREATVQGEARLGLTFEPVPGRTIPEVRGVLWWTPKTLDFDPSSTII